MTISNSNNQFSTTHSNSSSLINKISSELMEEHTERINKSFNKVYTDQKAEMDAFSKKIEGDYSTYSAKELSKLSYKEVKENYDEIKKVVEERMAQAQTIINSHSFLQYQVGLQIERTKNDDLVIRGGSKEADMRFEIYKEENFTPLIELGKEVEPKEPLISEDYRNVVTKEHIETQDLLNFNDKLKIVNFFENDEINEAIYSRYKDNAQIFYEEPFISDLNGENGFLAKSGYNIQGTDLNLLLQVVEDAKEYLEKNDYNGSSGSYKDGFVVIGEEIVISGKLFSIYDVKKASSLDKEPTEEIKEKEDIQVEKPDYSTYTPDQLRLLSFEEVKENFDTLKNILDNSLKANDKEYSQKDIDNLLAFKAQMEKVNYLENEDMNKTLYDKLKYIEDAKVALLSDLAITQNISYLKVGRVDSLIINGKEIFREDLRIKNRPDEIEEIKEVEDEKLNTQTIEKKQIDLDSIISEYKKIANNADLSSKETYKLELIEAYANFISHFNEIRESFLK